MKIIADTHTHTLACDHAYSTLNENAAAAKAKGLAAIAMTEHSPSLPGAPTWLHFVSTGIMPPEIDGVAIIRGIEVNIMDYDGALDFPDEHLQRLGWVIASLHTPTITPSTVEDHTRVWLNVAQNPLVDVIGHCGDPRYAFDHEVVLPAFKAGNKIVEINSHSFTVRTGSLEQCTKIARLCAEYEIPVVASSDAHHTSGIGRVEQSLEMLESIGFPERLILNIDKDRFFAALEEIKQRKAAIAL